MLLQHRGSQFHTILEGLLEFLAPALGLTETTNEYANRTPEYVEIILTQELSLS